MTGLALPFRIDGPILPNDGRLCYEADNRARTCSRRDHDGSAAAAAAPNDHSLGPRLTVRKRRLAALLPNQSSRAQHESSWQLLGQCGCRVILQQLEERTHQEE